MFLRTEDKGQSFHSKSQKRPKTRCSHCSTINTFFKGSGHPACQRTRRTRTPVPDPGVRPLVTSHPLREAPELRGSRGPGARRPALGLDRLGADPVLFTAGRTWGARVTSPLFSLICEEEMMTSISQGRCENPPQSHRHILDAQGSKNSSTSTFCLFSISNCGKEKKNT